MPAGLPPSPPSPGSDDAPYDLAALQSAILDSANYAIISTTNDGVVTTFNSTAERWLGYSADEVVGKKTPALWHDPAEVVARAAALTIELGHPVEPGFDAFVAKARLGTSDENEWTFIRKDGSRFPVSLSVTALRDDRGAITGFLGVIGDISKRKHAEEAQRESEARFQSAFDGAPIGMALVSTEGRWLRVNRALCDMIGYSEEELLATNFQAITHPGDLELDWHHARRLLAGEITSYQMEKRYFHKDGHIIYIMLSGSLVRDRSGAPLYFVAQIEDITDRKKAEEELASSLHEKEALLREIHHRVKNNMQVISSMLQMQSGYIKDPDLLEIFRERQGRIKTMALIHETLYGSHNLAEVEMKTYLQNLVSMLMRSVASRGTEITCRQQIDPVMLNADNAIPLGLIVNELISNAFKHGFRGRKTGELFLAFLRNEDGHLELTVRDDGAGLPPDIDLDQIKSLGLRLVKILCQQLHGTLAYESKDGSRFTVVFPKL